MTDLLTLQRDLGNAVRQLTRTSTDLNSWRRNTQAVEDAARAFEQGVALELVALLLACWKRVPLMGELVDFVGWTTHYGLQRARELGL